MKPAFSFVLACALLTGSAPRPLAQPGTAPSHVVIPILANATKPEDLDFQGGECELNANRTSMECVFQQVFLTTTAAAPDTCLITTNRYQRTFQRDTAADAGRRTASTSTRWVSNEGPSDECGVLDVATLQYDGGIKWTLEMRKVVTKKDASCRALAEAPETLSWQNARRPLPCKFVQPGGLSR